ncbi:L-type lectin-domain containing receptor kinase IX.2 [Capsicum annuum]|nr:L-type lectin-domain containing receptor kinase IX.2 [Capsicum annuum]
MAIRSSNICGIPLFIVYFLLPFGHSVSFQMSRFGPDTTDILYEGDAVASVVEIEFNKADYLCRVAHSIYREKVPLWDPDHSTKLADFSTHFSFTIDTYSAQSQIVSVEFDSFSNPEWDPPFEHVGINNNSITSSVTAPWNVSLHSGDRIDAWITYNATTNNLSVFWNYGLTALVGILFVSAILALVVLKKRRWKVKGNPDAISLTSFNDDLEKGAGPRKFSYKELDTSTNHFSEERKLGEGGFGEVYNGYLIDLDIAVAVKKISRGSKQGKKEYITEVKVISRLRHRNLVQLIGWCHDQGKFLLVYEFMPNGSLDFHLFGKGNPLSWAMRYKIALGLASALLYLHEEWEQCVIRRDIKSSNIMLDSSFNVKLGDFGLARLIDHELGPQTTGLAETLGYLAPEDFEQEQVERLMITGLWCAHPESNLRPSIRQAIHVLNFEASLPNLPMKMPVPVYYSPRQCGEPAVSSGSLR